jgi:hypothetical protein
VRSLSSPASPSGGGSPGPQRHGGEREVSVADQLGEPLGRDPRAEVLGRDVLELVCLVEDHRVVGGQDARGGAAGTQRAIGEVQVVVDEHQLRLIGEPAGLGDEAALEVRAARADPRVGRGGGVGPQRRGLGEPLDLGAIAGLGVRGPVDQRVDRDVAVARRRERVARAELGELAPARIVGHALEHDGGERPGEDRAQQRDVVARDLVLQRAGAGRHDDALAGQQRGDEVRQGLAGPGAGLDDQGAFVVERAGDRGRHRALLGAILVVGDRLGEAAAGGQQVAGEA